MQQDPYLNLRAQEDQITQIIASLSIEQGLKTVLRRNDGAPIEVKKIVKVLESLLSDTMLYQNNQLKQKVLERKNGWLEIKYLLNLKEVENVLIDVEFFKRIDKELIAKFIRTEIELYPCSLIVNKKRIRRKVPFVNKMSQVKPIFIEGYKEEEKMKSISESLASATQIYKLKFKIGQCWGIVYAADPQKILEMSETKNKKMEIDYDNQDIISDSEDQMEKFKAVSYEKIMQEYSKVQVGLWNERSLHFDQLKPFIKAYMDSEILETDADIFKKVQLQFDLSHYQDIFGCPKSLTQLIKALKAWDHGSMESEKQQLENQDLRRINEIEKNIKKTFSKRNCIKTSFGQIRKFIDEKLNNFFQNFFHFYRPSFEFNSKAFIDNPRFQNIQKNSLNQDLLLSPKDESLINQILKNKFLSLNLYKSQTSSEVNFKQFTN